jgi:hypothetical protein
VICRNKIMENKKMKMLKNKTAAIAIAFILTLTTSLPLILVPDVQAALELPTIMNVALAPNPVGIGQTAFVSAFLSKPLPTTSGLTGDYVENITIVVVKPDGQKEVLGPFFATATGGMSTTFTPDTVGNYTFQAFYPGQTLTGTNSKFPNQITTTNPQLIGTYMQPSQSEIVTLAVQEEQIGGYAQPPLPTQYWTRPIYQTNQNWASVLGGNWLGLAGAGGGGFGVCSYYDATGGYDPYTTAPNSAHILWTKPTADGGQVGGPITPDQNTAFQAGSVYTSYFEPIIIDGTIYYDNNPTMSNYKSVSSWSAVDLRTGEEIWNKPCGTTGNEWLRYGQVLMWHSIGEYGTSSYLWSLGSATWTTTRASPTGNMTLRLYDAKSGNYMGVQVINAMNLNMIVDTEANEQGTLLGWYISSGNLCLWNSTRALAYPTGDFAHPVDQFRPMGAINWSAGIEWSVPLPKQVDGNPISLSTIAVTPEQILVWNLPILAPLVSAGYMVSAGYDARKGTLLWGPLNNTLPRGDAIVDPYRIGGAGDGAYVLVDKDVSKIYGYSLTTGKLIWGPIELPHNAWSVLEYYYQIAYGNVYVIDYGGYVNCLNLTTGKIQWTHEPRSVGYDYATGYSSPYAYATSICDGKIFIAEGRRYTGPMYPDARRTVLNATTGDLIWDIMSWSPQAEAAFADGMIVTWNGYDKQIYTFGKGPSKTTISAPQVGITTQTPITLIGSINDISAGASQQAVAANFPNGLPCVSDASMKQFMEAVYMQQPMPTNLTGVPVSIDVFDSNGNYRNIGTVTSEGSGKFSFTWTPDIPGDFTVIATFAGSESYYPSYDETFFTAGNAAPTASPYPVTVLPPTEMYFGISTAAIIIAIAVVGFVLTTMLRKRP